MGPTRVLMSMSLWPTRNIGNSSHKHRDPTNLIVLGIRLVLGLRTRLRDPRVYVVVGATIAWTPKSRSMDTG